MTDGLGISRLNSSHLLEHIGLCWQRWDSFSILRNSGKTLEKHLRSSSDLCNVITELTAFYRHLLDTAEEDLGLKIVFNVCIID